VREVSRTPVGRSAPSERKNANPPTTELSTDTSSVEGSAEALDSWSEVVINEVISRQYVE
jgi:hypothetical protein